MRLFIALPVPDAVRNALDAALAMPRRATEEHLRWQQPDTWHLTLAFLGETPDDQVAGVGDTIAAALAPQKSFDVVLGRASRFGRAILFLGVDDPTYAAVVSLGEVVRASLDAADIAYDPKPLHPHLTLARQRDRRGRGVSRSQLELVTRALPNEPLGWRVDEVTMFASHVDDGPVHQEPLHRFPLG